MQYPPARCYHSHVIRPLLALACALFILSLRAYYVGFFNDDAFFLIGARSLLEGRFAELNHPAAPPLIQYLPGYPLLLAPLVGLFPGTFLPCQLLSVAMVLASILLFHRLTGGELPEHARIAAAALLALNPLTVSLSGTVLSGVPTLLLTLILLLGARAAWPHDRPGPWLALGLGTAAAFYLRPTGAAFMLALPLALLLERRWKPALYCAAAAFPCAAAWLIRNYLLRGHGLIYAAEFAAPHHGAPSWSLVQDNLLYYLRDLFTRTLLRWPWAGGGGAAAGAAVLAAAGSVLTAYGILKTGLRGWRAFGAIYAVAYATAILGWPKQSGRYLLPVLPFALLWLFAGLGSLERRWKRERVLVYGVLALGLASYLLPVAHIVRTSLFRSTPVNTPPEATFFWIRESTLPSDLLAADLDGRVHLHTGRPVLHLPPTRDAYELAMWSRVAGVRYVLAAPTDLTMRTPSGRSRHDPIPYDELTRMAERSGLLREVFSSEAEGTVVYEVQTRTPPI